jgi:hypothetical protein
MKNIFYRILNGVKKGLSTPNLSPQMLNFQGKPLIRLLRVLGGLSILILLGVGKGYFELHGFFLYMVILIGILFFLYHLYISYHRIKYIKGKLQSSDLDIRNSPLDRFGSMLARVMFCAKGICDTATPLGLGLGLMLGADQVLKDGGREAFFGPMIGMGLNKFLPKSELDHWKDTYLEATRNFNNASKNDQIITEFIQKTHDLKNVSSGDKKDLLELLTELKNASSVDLESAKSQTIKLLEDKTKK